MSSYKPPTNGGKVKRGDVHESSLLSASCRAPISELQGALQLTRNSTRVFVLGSDTWTLTLSICSEPMPSGTSVRKYCL